MVFELFGINGYLIIGVILGLTVIAAFLLSVTRKKGTAPPPKDWRQIALMIGIIYAFMYIFRSVIDEYLGVVIPAPGWVITILLIAALIIGLYKVLGQKGWDFTAKEIAVMVFVLIAIIATMIILPTTYPEMFSVKAIPEMQSAMSEVGKQAMSVVGLG